MNLFFQINDLKSTRLDVFIAKTLNDHGQELSRAEIQRLVKCGNVKVNGVLETKSSSKFSGDITLEIVKQEENFKKINQYDAVDLDLKIVYEDNDIAVIDKQPGVSMHDGAGAQNFVTLVNGLRYVFGDNLSDIDPSRPGIVHRIDKDTSGLVIVAKNNNAHFKLVESFKNHEIIKKYIAFSWGIPNLREFSINTMIGRSKKNRQKMAVLENDDERGKRAISNFKLLETYKNIASKISCTIETGRTHQIRVHLAHSHCPIIGDQLYTRSRVIAGELEFFSSFKRQALHAEYLGFLHPITKKWHDIFCDIPEDMKNLEAILQKYK